MKLMLIAIGYEEEKRSFMGSKINKCEMECAYESRRVAGKEEGRVQCFQLKEICAERAINAVNECELIGSSSVVYE